MPMVPVNSLVKQVKDLETIPIRIGEDPGVYLRDVATVSDASDIPTGYALVNGRRAVYILVTKRADASTRLGRRQRPRGPAEDAGGPARRHQGVASSSTSRRPSPGPSPAWRPRGPSARS